LYREDVKKWDAERERERRRSIYVETPEKAEEKTTADVRRRREKTMH
jgi:hypothetical protein